jgi:hypothetical protein
MRQYVSVSPISEGQLAALGRGKPAHKAYLWSQISTGEISGTFQFLKRMIS